jgi:hypothetical protein
VKAVGVVLVLLLMMAVAYAQYYHLDKAWVSPTPEIECLAEEVVWRELIELEGALINDTPLRVTGFLKVNIVHKPTSLKLAQVDTVMLYPGEYHVEEHVFINLFEEGYWVCYSTWKPLGATHDYFVPSRECTVWITEVK